jgi:hypothetical protein
MTSSGPVATHRIALMTQIIRLLLTMIPTERGYKLSEEPLPYETAEGLLEDTSMP